MVPTFCVQHSPLGRANAGDLPLAGDDGGEPNSESLSSSPCSPSRIASARMDFVSLREWELLRYREECAPSQNDIDPSNFDLQGNYKRRLNVQSM
jgi:hypothetical protein